jgi:tRNA-2-methylthio-N6-dimethylallyladenosine synthase
MEEFLAVNVRLVGGRRLHGADVVARPQRPGNAVFPPSRPHLKYHSLSTESSPFPTTLACRNFTALFGKMPSVFIKTYGCQMNERDSEAVAAQLVAKGYALAASEAVADVVLLNTCSVRDTAEQKALGKMQNLAAEVRRNRPNVVLGFMGCMAQSRGQELIDKLPDVDLVIGTQKFHRTADYLAEILAGTRDKVCDVGEESGSAATIKEHLLFGNSPTNGVSRQVTAFVSIMQGCNQYCTFCIVPYTRGSERSRSIADIVAEGRELVSRGVREITLLGQIVTSYGRREIGTKDGKSAFVQLIEAVHEIDGLDRIRFTSPHPKGYGDDLVEAYGRLPKLCESAHLPVQSGSDRVLKLMHRGYTRGRYLSIIEKLRRTQPGIGIGTDIIVGFPGETEEDFEQTLSLVREVQFDQAFVFKYSQRRDTPAAAMPNQIPQPLIEERHAELLKTVDEIVAAKLQRFLGQTAQILVEGPSRKNPVRLEGRTRCNRIVVFEGSPRHHGQLLDLKIGRASAHTLYGDPAIVGLEAEFHE